MKIAAKVWALSHCFALLLILNLTSNLGFAQVTASMTGRVEDASGAAIPGAMVSVRSLETGVVHAATADDGGAYRVLSLPVGRYEVKAEKTGFKTASQTGIDLVVGQQGVVNLVLEVGAVSEQVTVTAEAALVNTTTASVSGLVGEQEVKDLPLNGRSFDLLIALNAGTVNYNSWGAGGGAGHGGGNWFSVAGRRPSENFMLLNGIELTGPNQDVSAAWAVSGQMLGVDAIREFNVVTDAYGAQYGKRPGAQISIVTQSGTNQLHGSMFEFLRNSALDARNFFDNRIGPPPFERNQFGGALGGPIRKDKTFVFGNYEGFRQRLGLSSVSTVPDENARKGLMPCVAATSTTNPTCPTGTSAGTPVQVPNLNPGMLPYLAYWPQPTPGQDVLVNGLPTGVAKSFSNPIQTIREDYGTVRVDHYFSTKDALAGIYTIVDGFKPSPDATPTFQNTQILRNQVLSLQETHTFSPTLLNVFTAGLSRVGYHADDVPAAGFPSGLNMVQGWPGGSFAIGGSVQTGGTLSAAGAAANPLYLNAKTLFTYEDEVQMVRGRHQISAGIWLQRMRSNETGASGIYGNAAFANEMTFLQGNLTSFNYVRNATPRSWRQLMGAWYLQDNIQLRPNLSFRIGLRDEFSNLLNSANGKSANFIYGPNGVMLTDPLLGNTPFTENNQKSLLGPRVGLAWDPFGKGKTSIRAAFGTHYILVDNPSLSLNAAPPYNPRVTYVPPAGGTLSFLSVVPASSSKLALPIACGDPGALPSPNCTIYTPRNYQPNFKAPTVEEWTLAIEQQINRDMSLRVAYVGSEGYHEVTIMDGNSIPGQTCTNAAGCVSGGVNAARGLVSQGTRYVPVGTRPNPNLLNCYCWDTEGVSNYNALQIEVKKRMTHGLEFRGNYTWAKSLDINGGGATSNDVQNVMDPYNLRSDWGPSPEDFRHQASLSGSYELPIGPGKPWLAGTSGVASKIVGGWQVNWIVTLLSGFAFSPIVGTNISGNGDLFVPDRPNLNPSFTGSKIVGTANEWYDPHAYSLPVPGTFGNVGRDVLRGAGLRDVDFSLFKTTKVTERIGLQFRAEVFNVFNHANLGLPNRSVFSGGALSPTAGLIIATNTPSRQIQFGLKLTF